MLILHLSDPHFGTEQPHVVSALRQFITQHQPELVLLGGDITQRARRSQFSAARAFVDDLPCPALVVPGNHDIPLFNLFARLFNPYGNYRRAFGDELEPVLEQERLLVIGLNSTTPGRHKNGEVSAAQIERVRARLARAAPQQLRIVLQHHPVRALQETDIGNLLIGHEQAVPAWVDAGLDLLLAGHIHLPYVLPLRGYQGEAGRRGWTVQAGTALSYRVRGNVPNSFNLIRYRQPGECVAERWDYSLLARAFLCEERHELPLSR
ncbi:DNA repair exonuclease [Alcanivorax sp. S71-1-4]|jgi:3',5'-cyclic AMP phosphodiesterase CpdA|uniref:metallophosphoesterase family protein n=1 Tax=Alcanivorax sp. S71-1-4 TaxID=1177159 RepID=UPI00135CADEB|nr:metallophosphoesterase [Alcanivorax sp. S71-1-4]KAF0808704.1 DNA repair exonuclease [Alcanivorax sp. S71-1-4]